MGAPRCGVPAPLPLMGLGELVQPLPAAPRFAPLFADLPAHDRMRALVRSADQHTLGAFVHACFERRTVAP
jgi:hypothetical protein